MGKIRWGRLILGCLIGGFVFNIAVIPLNIWETEMFEAMYDTLGVSLETLTELPSGQYALLMTVWLLIGLALGGGGVVVYVAIRPRFGAGLKTALYAGVMVWFFSYALPFTMSALSLIHPVGLAAHVILTHVVAMCLATAAGAWFYREE